MTLFLHRCTGGCGGSATFTSENREESRCPLGHPAKRKYTPPTVHRGMGEHFNMAAGQYVTNQRDLEDKLKEASHKASEELGMEHRFKPASAGELAEMNPGRLE